MDTSSSPSTAADLRTSTQGHGVDPQDVVLRDFTTETATARIEDINLGLRRRIVIHKRPRSTNVPITIEDLDVRLRLTERDDARYVAARDSNGKAMKVRVNGDVAVLVATVQSVQMMEESAFEAIQILLWGRP